MVTTISRDFGELRMHIAELEPEAVREELDELLTGRSTGEPAPLTTLAGLHEITYDFNGKDDIIELLEGISGAIQGLPDSEAQTRTYLSRHAIASILGAFGQVDMHRRAQHDIGHLSREAAWLTDYIANPRQEALALFSVSRAITGSRAANAVDRQGLSLFWDALGHLEDAGKAAQAEENPEVRSRLLSLLAQQAIQNIGTAEISGAIEGHHMGNHFIERVHSLAERLFGEAMVVADADFFTSGNPNLDGMPNDPLGLSADKGRSSAKPQTATGQMAQRLAYRLVATAS